MVSQAFNRAAAAAFLCMNSPTKESCSLNPKRELQAAAVRLLVSACVPTTMDQKSIDEFDESSLQVADRIVNRSIWSIDSENPCSNCPNRAWESNGIRCQSIAHTRARQHQPIHSPTHVPYNTESMHRLTPRTLPLPRTDMALLPSAGGSPQQRRRRRQRQLEGDASVGQGTVRTPTTLC